MEICTIGRNHSDKRIMSNLADMQHRSSSLFISRNHLDNLKCNRSCRGSCRYRLYSSMNCYYRSGMGRNTKDTSRQMSMYTVDSWCSMSSLSGRGAWLGRQCS